MKHRAIAIAAFAAAFAQLCASQPFNAQPDLSHPPTSSLTEFRLGEQWLQQHDYQNAAIRFQRALSGDKQPAWTVVWSHIDLGKVFDLTGQHDRARTEYHSAVDTHDDTLGAQGIAKMSLLAPVEPDLMPLSRDVDGYVQPKILTQAEPQYTQEALLARLEGTVMVETSVGADGRILDVRARTSLGLGLDEAAANAVRLWTFSPATQQGLPVPATAYVDVNFHLPGLPGWHVKKIEFAPPRQSARPTLTQGTRYMPDKMPPDLVEEAGVDTAMRRVPDASISMDIDTSGAPANLQVTSASLPEWGDDAVRAIREWRFSSGSRVTPCTIELAWFPAK